MNIYLVSSDTSIGQHVTAHTSEREARREARRRDGSWEWSERHASLADFVRSRATYDTRGRRCLLADLRVPDSVHVRLCRRYGAPTTFDRGEVAYWQIPDQDVP